MCNHTRLSCMFIDAQQQTRFQLLSFKMEQNGTTSSCMRNSTRVKLLSYSVQIHTRVKLFCVIPVAFFIAMYKEKQISSCIVYTWLKLQPPFSATIVECVASFHDPAAYWAIVLVNGTTGCIYYEAFHYVVYCT